MTSTSQKQPSELLRVLRQLTGTTDPTERAALGERLEALENSDVDSGEIDELTKLVLLLDQQETSSPAEDDEFASRAAAVQIEAEQLVESVRAFVKRHPVLSFEGLDPVVALDVLGAVHYFVRNVGIRHQIDSVRLYVDGSVRRPNDLDEWQEFLPAEEIGLEIQQCVELASVQEGLTWAAWAVRAIIEAPGLFRRFDCRPVFEDGSDTPCGVELAHNPEKTPGWKPGDDYLDFDC